MADETQVETAVTEQNASKPAPATPEQKPVDVESLKSAAYEQAKRELQSAKDREVASLHRQYQEREAKLRAKARSRLAQHDEGAATALDYELENESVLDEARAIVQQQKAKEDSARAANDIADVYGLKGNDPRLLGATSWDDFRAKAKAAAAEDVRKEREAAKAAEDERARKAVDRQIASGELNTLDIKPSGAVKATLEDEYKRELAKIPRGQVKALTELKFKYRKKGLAI
jgi:hypothetical protein